MRTFTHRITQTTPTPYDLSRGVFVKIILLIFSFALLTACSTQPDAYDSQGKAIRLSDYQGKWVIINYWANWCKPCLKEMPALNQIYQSNKNKLVVLGVSFDKLTSSEINNTIKKMNIYYPMLSTFPLEKLGITKTLSVLPITFIINPKGKLVKTLKGPRTKKQFLHAVNLV